MRRFTKFGPPKRQAEDGSDGIKVHAYLRLSFYANSCVPAYQLTMNAHPCPSFALLESFTRSSIYLASTCRNLLPGVVSILHQFAEFFTRSVSILHQRAPERFGFQIYRQLSQKTKDTNLQTKPPYQHEALHPCPLRRNCCRLCSLQRCNLQVCPQDVV
jgi:hypothetical protein